MTSREEPESYTFMCDLDRNRPEVDRAAVTLQEDGEHITVNIYETGHLYAGTVYLTPADAANFGKLAVMLAEDDEPEIPADGNAVAGCLVATMLMSYLVAVVAMVVALNA